MLFRSIFSYTLQRLADKHGFTFASMQTKPLQTFSNIASAIRGGAIDAGTMTAPSALPLIQRGEAKVLAWMAERYDIDTAPGASTSFVSRGSNKWRKGVTVKVC